MPQERIGILTDKELALRRTPVVRTGSSRVPDNDENRLVDWKHPKLWEPYLPSNPEGEWRRLSELRLPPSGRALTAELTKDEQSRQRYRTQPQARYLHLGPRVGVALSIFSRSAPDSAREIIHTLANILTYCTTDGQWFEHAKQISDFAFKYGDSWRPDWYYAKDWHLWVGYQIEEDEKVLENALVEWMSYKPPKTIAGSAERFITAFTKGVRDWFRRAPRPRFDPLPVSEWVKRPELWSTSGGSGMASTAVRVRVNGKRMTIRSKNAAAATLPPEKLAEWVLKPTPLVNKAIAKRETGKVRSVVTADMGS